MTQIAAKPQREVEPKLPENFEPLEDPRAARERRITKLRLLWSERRFLLRATGVGLACATLLAFLIPRRYESTVRLMPPDSESGTGMALMASLSGQAGGLGALAGELLGMKSTGALFVGVLRSRTVQDGIVNRFQLKRVYGTRLAEKARTKLDGYTDILEDRKSGIISVKVSDRDPKRAAAIAGDYVNQLDTLMAQLTTSSAHRERVFLEERLNAVQHDLESAEKDFSQFASKNGAIDIGEQGKAMVQAGASLEGQLIAVQSELEGLKQIYTENNVRVRSTQARITELRHQLEKLGGKADLAHNGNDTSIERVYPSLRQLPVLGVPYADLLRRTKVQEAVFEALTKEYELSKVQEAKEIPTVRILDPPDIPERRAFPPRLLIVTLGTLCVMTLGCIWLLGTARWQEMDPQDPGRVLVQEVFHTLKGRIPRISTNGSRLSAIAAKLRNRSGRGEGQSSG